MKNIPMKKIKTSIPTINTVIVNSLPDDVPALTSRNPDGSYTIALNGSLTHERLEQEYLHEVSHIESDHFALPTADHAEKKVREIVDDNSKPLLSETISDKPYDEVLQKRLAQLEERRKKNRRKRKRAYNSREAQFYPPGAYEEMKARGWI